MSLDRPPGPLDYMRAHDIVRHLQVNLAIHYKAAGDTFTPPQAKQHFADRAALVRTQELLLDAMEKAAGLPG